MDDSGTHLWLILWKAYEAMRAHAEHHIAGSGLGYTDFAILEALLHKGPTPVNLIGRRVHLTSGSITAAVDRLEAKGLVERTNDPADRRARVVSLTPLGRALIEEVFARHCAAMESAAGGLSREERAQAIDLLRRLGIYARHHSPA